MKLIYPLLLLFFIPLFAFSQPTKDTITLYKSDSTRYYKIIEYNVEGLKEKITFTTDLKKDADIQDLFMRGVRRTSSGSLVDSIFWYHDMGVLIRKEILQGSPEEKGNYFYEYDENGKINWIVKKVSATEVIYQLFKEGTMELKKRFETIEGKIGQTVSHPIRCSVPSGTHKQTISLTVSSPDILIVPVIVVEPKTNYTIELKATIQEGINKSELIFKNDAGEKAKLPIEMIGYDLHREDFTPKYDPKQKEAAVLKKRTNLILKSDGTEKLVRFYRGDTHLGSYPSSLAISEYDLSAFAKGEYRIEMIDLSSNEKKYCKIRID